MANHVEALTLFFINDHLGRDDTSPARIATLRALVASTTRTHDSTQPDRTRRFN